MLDLSSSVPFPGYCANAVLDLSPQSGITILPEKLPEVKSFPDFLPIREHSNAHELVMNLFQERMPRMECNNGEMRRMGYGEKFGHLFTGLIIRSLIMLSISPPPRLSFLTPLECSSFFS